MINSQGLSFSSVWEWLEPRAWQTRLYFCCLFVFFFQSHNLFTISPHHPGYIAAPLLLSGETILRKWLALSDYLDSHHRAPLRFSHTLQPTLCVPHGRDCWGPVGEWKVSTAEQRHVWHLASIPSRPRSYYCMKVPPTASARHRAFSNSLEAASAFCAWEWRRRNKRSTWAKIRYEPCACYPQRFWPMFNAYFCRALSCLLSAGCFQNTVLDKLIRLAPAAPCNTCPQVTALTITKHVGFFFL